MNKYYSLEQENSIAFVIQSSKSMVPSTSGIFQLQNIVLEV